MNIAPKLKAAVQAAGGTIEHTALVESLNGREQVYAATRWKKLVAQAGLKATVAQDRNESGVLVTTLSYTIEGGK